MWEKIKTAFRRMKLKIDEIIPSHGLQIGILVAFVVLDAVLAYLVALFDYGIWHGDSSIGTLFWIYTAGGRSFPVGTWLLLTALLLILFVWLIFKLRDTGDRNFKYSESDVYGSARELTEEDIKKSCDVLPIEELPGTILGQLDNTTTKVIGLPPKPTANKNIIIAGSPGDGKSFSGVKPAVVQAIRRGESVVLTDTKYEGRADTIEFARRNGYKIRNFDLKDLRMSDGWAILKELRFDDVRAEDFAAIVMNNTGNETDPHLALEQTVLRACCLYVERSSAIPEQEKNLYTAYAMILQGAEALDKVFENARYDPNLRVAADAYAPFLNGSDRLRGNVLGNLTARISILSTARNVVSTDDIDLSLPGKEKCLYYVCMSDTTDTMKFLATLFFSFLIADLVDYADSTIDRKLPVPVNVILEEAANVGKILSLPKYFATARSRGIAIMLIVQNIGQLYKLYGEYDTSTMLNACVIHACIGTMDPITAEHFETMSGIATVKVKTEQHEKYETPLTMRYHNSTGDGRRNVYTKDEIFSLRQGEVLIVWKGLGARKCRTFGIIQHPEYIRGNMPSIPPRVNIPLDNVKARAFLRAMEDIRISEYEAWVHDGGDPWPGYVWPRPQYDGASRRKPRPEIIPYPELEKMALEYAAQEKLSLEEALQEYFLRREEERQSSGEPLIIPPEDDPIEPDTVELATPFILTPLAIPDQEGHGAPPTDPAPSLPAVTEPVPQSEITEVDTGAVSEAITMPDPEKPVPQPRPESNSAAPRRRVTKYATQIDKLKKGDHTENGQSKP